jgi:lysozyme family protein
MSQFEPALDYLLDFEDAPRAYNAVSDVGGYAIAGINSASWPNQYAQIASLPQASRGSAVANFYRLYFWNPTQAGALTSQDIANRLLDQAVNGGQVSGVKLLQKAANQCGAALVQDGTIGPRTITAVNAINPVQLLTAYRAARAANYRAIVEAKPQDEQYLAEWLKRAEA